MPASSTVTALLRSGSTKTSVTLLARTSNVCSSCVETAGAHGVFADRDDHDRDSGRGDGDGDAETERHSV